MLIVLSPAKTLDFETPPHVDRHTQPSFIAEARRLVDRSKELDAAQLASLMSISDTLGSPGRSTPNSPRIGTRCW